MTLVVSYSWPRDEAAKMNGFSNERIRKRRKVERKKYLASKGLVEMAFGSRSEMIVKAEVDKKDLRLGMIVKEIQSSNKGGSQIGKVELSPEGGKARWIKNDRIDRELGRCDYSSERGGGKDQPSDRLGVAGRNYGRMSNPYPEA